MLARRNSKPDLMLFLEINNISVGGPNPLHAIISTFPDNYSESLLPTITAIIEGIIFACTSFGFNYCCKNRLESHKQNINLASSASNAFVFSYGFCCEIIALAVGKRVKLDADMIATLISVLVFSVGLGGITLYRDIKQSSGENPLWPFINKSLNLFLLFLAEFNIVNQVVKMITSIKESSEKDTILTSIEIALMILSFVVPFLACICEARISKNITRNLGAFGNIFHDAVMCVDASKSNKIYKGLTMASLFSKPLIGAAIYCHKACKNRYEELPEPHQSFI